MTALLWAEWKQLMRTLRSRRGILDLAVVFVSALLLGLGLVLFISIVASAPGRSPAGVFVTALLVLLTSIPLGTSPHTLAGVLPEWAFAQPIPARKAMVFTWLIASGKIGSRFSRPIVASRVLFRFEGFVWHSECLNGSGSFHLERHFGLCTFIAGVDGLENQLGACWQIVENMGEGSLPRRGCFAADRKHNF
jgi:hypothetical protein